MNGQYLTPGVERLGECDAAWGISGNVGKCLGICRYERSLLENTKATRALRLTALTFPIFCPLVLNAILRNIRLCLPVGGSKTSPPAGEHEAPVVRDAGFGDFEPPGNMIYHYRRPPRGYSSVKIKEG